VPTTSEPNKQTNDFNKKTMEEFIIEELSRKFETVLLVNMNRWTQNGKEMYRCVWCDILQHQKCRDCDELREVIHRNVVYLDGFVIC
jgi:DNA relaxase NicK